MVQKQNKRPAQAAEQKQSGNVGTPVLIGLAAGLAGFFFWRLRQQKQDGAPVRSPFRFPATSKAKASAGAAASAASAATSSLPRSKASSNKKNKARKKQERERRAEKEEKSAAAAPKAAAAGDEGQPSSTAVINYTYFDSARRDTLLPTHKKKTLTAADVMPTPQPKQP